MAILKFDGDPAYRRFDQAECERAGAARAAEYQNAAPFPHIVMDDFLARDLLRDVAGHYLDRLIY